MKDHEDHSGQMKIPKAVPPMPSLGNDWMDDVVREQEDLGTFTDLPGKGKRLNLKPNFNIADHIMEQNHLLPPWLRLRQEIYQDIKTALSLLDRNDLAALEERIAAINMQIGKYNRSCPSPLLQRNLLSGKTLRDAAGKWAGDL